MSVRELSIVIPLFDEEESVEILYAELTAVLARTAAAYEILLIDDGSRDRTPARLRSLQRRDPRVRVVRLARNYGQAAALQAGFDHARGQVVVTMDGDLQSDPADIPRLLELLASGFDVVSGWRKDRWGGSPTRRIPSLAANWLIRLLTGVRVHDNGCTLRAYRREVIERARLYSDLHRFLVPLVSLSGGRVGELVVNHRERQFGRSKYGLARIWKVLLDLLGVKMLIRFSSNPVAWFAWLGLPFVLLAVLSAGLGLALLATGRVATELGIVLPSVVLLSTFAAVHLVLVGMFAELVVRLGDYRETQPILVDCE